MKDITAPADVFTRRRSPVSRSMLARTGRLSGRHAQGDRGQYKKNSRCIDHAKIVGQEILEKINNVYLNLGLFTTRLQPADVNWVSGEDARSLLLALLSHYPDMIYPARCQDLRQKAVPLDHPITASVRPAEQRGNGMVVSLKGTGRGPHTEVHASSARAALAAPKEYAGTEVDILGLHPHPQLSRLVCLWAGGRRWRQTRSHYKKAAQTTVRLDGRTAKWVKDDAVIATALGRVQWKDIRRITGATAWGEQILYRLKHRALSNWDPTNDRIGCPIEECLHPVATPAHTFWDCPGAAQLWQLVQAPWRVLGATADTIQARNIFSLELAVVPPALWQILDELYHHLPEEEREDVRRHVHGVMQHCWNIGVVVMLQAIWKRRCRYRDTYEDATAERALALLQGRLRTAYLTIRLTTLSTTRQPAHHMAAKVCRTALTQTSSHSLGGLTPTTEREQLVLFFDGGSRGNPGPGGSGSAIVKIGGTPCAPTILWMASVSYAHKTTNNIAKRRL
ncbi:hypothetical protein PHYPSEUDO_012865 [Phytophthora pseudosyringae]|uniref:RNase H type-1 domain-containing protein n=1 Tax=Phytophthora pseudosyringae TaxID=221518 RepID=A0A8T1V8V6_9STRA|nr:hypothetical protein PHYPSEUDO_012865 [Phytophthora pseudosyringae]